MTFTELSVAAAKPTKKDKLSPASRSTPAKLRWPLWNTAQTGRTAAPRVAPLEHRKRAVVDVGLDAVVVQRQHVPGDGQLGQRPPRQDLRGPRRAVGEGQQQQEEGHRDEVRHEKLVRRHDVDGGVAWELRRHVSVPAAWT